MLAMQSTHVATASSIVNCLIIERFSIQYRKTMQIKVTTLTNHNRRKQHKGPIRIRLKTRVTGAKRGKTRASEARLVLVLLLIG